jgi:hypothetical protein
MKVTLEFDVSKPLEKSDLYESMDGPKLHLAISNYIKELGNEVTRGAPEDKTEALKYYTKIDLYNQLSRSLQEQGLSINLRRFE